MVCISLLCWLNATCCARKIGVKLRCSKDLIVLKAYFHHYKTVVKVALCMWTQAILIIPDFVIYGLFMLSVANNNIRIGVVTKIWALIFVFEYLESTTLLWNPWRQNHAQTEPNFWIQNTWCYQILAGDAVSPLLTNHWQNWGFPSAQSSTVGYYHKNSTTWYHRNWTTDYQTMRLKLQPNNCYRLASASLSAHGLIYGGTIDPVLQFYSPHLYSVF